MKEQLQLCEFLSRANTLEFFEDKITKSKIEKSYSFTVKMWMYDGKKILEDIQKKFVGKIVIRSSALGEDSLDKSEAGKFQTILNINSSIKKDVKKGIDDVIKSYKIKGKMNESHLILIQIDR